jgi:hypothetical protein
VRYSRFIIAFALAAGAARGVQVDVPFDEATVNLGLLLQAGHRYEFRNIGRQHLDESEFVVPEAELRVYGLLFNKLDYDLRVYTYYYSRGVREAYVGTPLPAGFSSKIGRIFVPFGVEATTYEGYLTCSSRTFTSSAIAPGRNYGVRFDYLLERNAWPYRIGAAAGVFNGSGPLVNGAGRIYGAAVPAIKNLEIGVSYFYAKTLREKYRAYAPNEEHYLEEPRFGADVSFEAWRFEFLAEYMQHFINDYPIRAERYREPYFVYKDTYERGYFGTLVYTHPLPWRYFQDFAPYARYERWKPAVVERGYIPEDRYTAGFALHFLGRNLMFRSDYTRILEDEYRTSNDVIASEFQVMF